MRITFITLVVLALNASLIAQPWLKNLPAGKSKSELTLFDYQQAFESYWAPFQVDKGYYFENGVKKKAPGWKQFKRWEYDMQSKVDVQTGKFPQRTALDIVREYQQTHPAPRSSSSANWSPMGPTYSFSGYSGIGRINCVSFHPTDLNTYWVGAAAGGLWETKDNGETWTCLTNNNGVLAVSDIVVPADYETSQIMYIATGDRDGWDNRSIGVLKSTDGGQTWSSTGLSFTIQQGQMTNRLLMDPVNPDILIAGTTQGVYKTTDGGVTWNTQMTGIEFIDMEFKPGDPSIIYGSTKGGSIFLSFDGATFSQEIFHDDAARRTELAVTPADPTLVYVLCSNEGSGLHAIFKSTDSGNSFEEVFSGSVKNLLTWESDGSGGGGQGWYDLTIAASPINADVVVVGGVNSWRSIDGGFDWHIINHWYGDQVQSVHADKHMLRFRPNGDLFECNDGGIYHSLDDGTSWSDRTNGMQISQMYRLGVSQTEAGDVITGLQDNGTKSLSNNNWSDVIGGDGMECLIDYTDTDIQYGTLYFGALSRTTNHWQSSDGITPPDEGAWVTPFVIDPSDPNTLYGGYSELWKTTDRGNNWTQISDINLDGRMRAVAVAASDNRFIYVSNYNQIWATTDGGGTWNNITNNLPTSQGSIEYITVKHDNPSTIWVVLSGYAVPGVYESLDGGTTWNSISEGLPQIPAYSLVENIQHTSETHLYLGTELGVYFKEAGHDWVPYNNGLPNVKTGEIEIYYDGNPGESKLRAATYGRGLWETTIEYTPSPMVYVSSTAVQKNTKNIEPGQTGQDILKVEVLTNGNLNPFSITSLTFNANGSTNPSGDIARARLYYTGSSGVFSTANQFGEVQSPSGEFTFSDVQELGNGKNNFWLAYDLYDNAQLGNIVDAQCLSVTVNTPQDLIVSDPEGSRTIGFEYCEAGAANMDYEYISNVAMGTINNPSDKGSNGFQDYTGLTLDVIQGQTLPVRITNGVPYFSDQVLIWGDWNVDGDFDDAGELSFESPTFGGSIFECQLVVPEDAQPGKTRIRIRLHDLENGPNITPCDYATWGEVEDYTLMIHAPDACGELNYFSYKAENIPGAYLPLESEGTTITTDNFDNAHSDPQEIGFPFHFKCDTFTQFVLNTNGFVKLGNTPTSSDRLYFNDARVAFGGVFESNHPDDANILCPMNIDLTGGAGTPEYRVHTSGDAPNRVCTIQFKDLKESGLTTTPQFDNIEFQVKLYETSDIIEFVYGDWTPSGQATDYIAVGCGIKGSDSRKEQLLTGHKDSLQTWSEMVFLNDRYNFFEAVTYATPPSSPKPDPGRTIRFKPTRANDLAVKQVYTLGEASVYYSSPVAVQALIENSGRNVLGNIPVSLHVSGAISHDDELATGILIDQQTGTYTFEGYTSASTGPANVTIRLADDDDLTNNELTWEQQLTDFDISYAALNDEITKMGIAPNEQYILQARYHVTGTAAISGIKAFIPDDASNTGRTVYGVVLNSANEIVAQSDPYVIEESALGSWHTFNMSVPPVVTDDAFFAGYAVTAHDQLYYPVGIQNESPLRTNTFFTSGLDGQGISALSVNTRLMIGAVLSPTAPVAGIAGSDLVVCSGTGGDILIQEYEGFIQWQQSPDGVSDWINVTEGLGGNSEIYTTPALTSTTYYRAEVSQPTFDPVYTNIVQVLVTQTPAAAGPIQGPTSVCVGDTLVYWVDPIADAQNYVWSLPDGFIAEPSKGSQIQVVIGASAITGPVSVLGVNLGCPGESSSQDVIVNPQPEKPTTQLTGNTLTSSATDGNQWYNASGPISGAVGQEYVVTEDGEYYVIVTQNGCSSEASDPLVVIISSVEIAFGTSKVSVFPNPVSAQLNISVPGIQKPVRYVIVDTPGKVLTSGTFSGSTLIDTRLFTPGMYFVRLDVDDQSVVAKFVKE